MDGLLSIHRGAADGPRTKPPKKSVDATGTSAWGLPNERPAPDQGGPSAWSRSTHLPKSVKSSEESQEFQPRLGESQYLGSDSVSRSCGTLSRPMTLSDRGSVHGTEEETSTENEKCIKSSASMPRDFCEKDMREAATEVAERSDEGYSRELSERMPVAREKDSEESKSSTNGQLPASRDSNSEAECSTESSVSERAGSEAKGELHSGLTSPTAETPHDLSGGSRETDDELRQFSTESVSDEEAKPTEPFPQQEGRAHLVLLEEKDVPEASAHQMEVAPQMDSHDPGREAVANPAEYFQQAQLLGYADGQGQVLVPPRVSLLQLHQGAPMIQYPLITYQQHSEAFPPGSNPSLFDQHRVLLPNNSNVITIHAGQVVIQYPGTAPLNLYSAPVIAPYPAPAQPIFTYPPAAPTQASNIPPVAAPPALNPDPTRDPAPVPYIQFYQGEQVVQVPMMSEEQKEQIIYWERGPHQEQPQLQYFPQQQLQQPQVQQPQIQQPQIEQYHPEQEQQAGAGWDPQAQVQEQHSQVYWSPPQQQQPTDAAWVQPPILDGDNDTQPVPDAVRAVQTSPERKFVSPPKGLPPLSLPPPPLGQRPICKKWSETHDGEQYGNSDRQGTAGESPGDVQMGTGESPGESQMRTGEPLGERQKRTGEPLGERQKRTRESPGDIQKRTEESLGESQMRTGEPLGERQKRTGESPGDIQMRTGESPGDVQMRTGESLGDVQMRTGESPGDVQMRTSESPGDSQGRAQDSSKSSKKDAKKRTKKWKTRVSAATQLRDEAGVQVEEEQQQKDKSTWEGDTWQEIWDRLRSKLKREMLQKFLDRRRFHVTNLVLGVRDDEEFFTEAEELLLSKKERETNNFGKRKKNCQAHRAETSDEGKIRWKFFRRSCCTSSLTNSDLDQIFEDGRHRVAGDDDDDDSGGGAEDDVRQDNLGKRPKMEIEKNPLWTASCKFGQNFGLFFHPNLKLKTVDTPKVRDVDFSIRSALIQFTTQLRLAITFAFRNFPPSTSEEQDRCCEVSVCLQMLYSL